MVTALLQDLLDGGQRVLQRSDVVALFEFPERLVCRVEDLIEIRGILVRIRGLLVRRDVARSIFTFPNVTAALSCHPIPNTLDCTPAKQQEREHNQRAEDCRCREPPTAIPRAAIPTAGFPRITIPRKDGNPQGVQHLLDRLVTLIGDRAEGFRNYFAFRLGQRGQVELAVPFLPCQNSQLAFRGHPRKRWERKVARPQFGIGECQ